MDNDLAFFIIVGAALYLFPTLIGFLRSHKQLGSLFMLNVLLGWSGLGWIAALIFAFWSFKHPKPESPPKAAT